MRGQAAQHLGAQAFRHQPPQAFLVMMEHLPAISRHGFIRAVTRQRDRHAFARKLADPPGPCPAQASGGSRPTRSLRAPLREA